jgi:UDP-N-acetylmuramoyl-tripeptide--D-alanyl-D-alanine ligase
MFRSTGIAAARAFLGSRVVEGILRWLPITRRRWWKHVVLGYSLSAGAFFWRRLMFRTTFVAVTGSAGKTTATDSLGAILAAHAPTNWTPGGRNGRWALARNILRTRFWHRFAVIEVGTQAPGALRRASWMIAPDIAVVLRVLNIHTDGFPTLEAVAAEKAQLLSRLGKRGCAILNADDPRVLAMQARCRGPVRTFGRASESYLNASEVSAKWPRRLSFRARCGDQSQWVETNLVGEHFLGSALAALAVAVHCGVPLERAAARFRDIQPVPGRMHPMVLKTGVTVLHDEYNGALPALEAALDLLQDAEAGRRVVIVGDVLDVGLTVRPRLREIGRRVVRGADMAVFVGRESRTSAKAAVIAGMKEQSAHAFRTPREAAAFLQTDLRPGDLVLLHGWEGRHIERVILGQMGTVLCRKERCLKRIQCDKCPELGFVPVHTLAAPRTAAETPMGAL